MFLHKKREQGKAIDQMLGRINCWLLCNSYLEPGFSSLQPSLKYQFLLYILRFAFPYRDSGMFQVPSFFFLSQSLSSCTLRIKHKMKHSQQMSFTEQFQHRHKSLIEPFGIKRRKINSLLLLSHLSILIAFTTAAQFF